jgi:hypothetical protein
MSSWTLSRIVSHKLIDVLEVLTASIIRATMEAISTFETSVSLYETAWRNFQEDSFNVYSWLPDY